MSNGKFISAFDDLVIGHRSGAAAQIGEQRLTNVFRGQGWVANGGDASPWTRLRFRYFLQTRTA